MLAHKLIMSFYHWRDRYTQVTNEKAKKRIKALINWNFGQVIKFFKLEAIKLMFQSGER